MAWTIRATLLSPACFNQRRGVGNVLSTLDYIPGGTVRGALAARWLQQTGNTPADAGFKGLFLEETVSFPDLNFQGGVPLPLTARTCKYFEGFIKGVQQHGVVDAVIPWLRHQTIMDSCEAPRCGAPLEPCRGFYRVERNGSYHNLQIGKRLLARTAILAGRGVVKKGDLYTLEVLNEGQVFEGTFLSHDDIAKELKALIDADPQFYLGYSRTRGLGEAELKIFEITPAPGPALEQKLREFNRQLHGKDKKVTHFTVTLQCDAILLNDLLGYRDRPEVADFLAAAGGGPGEDLLASCHFVTAWIDTGRVSGWQAAWRLPKPEEQTLKGGAVFIFGWGTPLPDDQISQLAQALQRLEDKGLGERPIEGFGRVRVCDEFHWKRWRRK